MSGRVRVPRGRRGAVASLAALIGALACAFAALQAISLAAHRRTVWFSVHDVARFGRDTALGDRVVLVIAIAAFAVGALLAVAALAPPRRRLVELRQRETYVAAGLTRRSVRRALSSAAVEVDGVTGASVSGWRPVRVQASTSLRHADHLLERVSRRVTDRLDQLAPVRAHRVRVSLRRTER